MDCTTVLSYLDAYIDGELDLVTSIEIERHLADCPDCPERLRQRQWLREGLRSESLRFTAPPNFQKQIETEFVSPKRSSLMEPARQHLWLSMVAALLVGVLITVGLFRVSAPVVDPNGLLARQVLDSHIRSLMVDHLADVVSTDKHTVKPWFDGKVDFSPTVIDLAAQGFPLTGGRLDYLAGKPVTALVYQYQKHLINLFMQPASGQAAASFSTTLQGYHLIHWSDASFSYWAVSDLEMTELQTFVLLIQADITNATPLPTP